jgi:hypothetical protein
MFDKLSKCNMILKLLMIHARMDHWLIVACPWHGFEIGVDSPNFNN